MKSKKNQNYTNSCVQTAIEEKQMRKPKSSGKKNEECPFCHGHNIEKFDEYLMAKIKLDIPRPIVERIRDGPPILPQIPENEIMGAISHVEADFGLTGEPKHDMPLIAKSVAEECRKHLYSSCGNLFPYYTKYMGERKGNWTIPHGWSKDTLERKKK